MDKFSYVGTSDVSAIDSLYQQYLQNPESVDATWKDFFKGFEFAQTAYGSGDAAIPENVAKEFKVIGLINGYRQRGHLFTKTNPVRQRRKYEPTLDLENFGLTEKDLDTVFHAGNEIGIGAAKLKDIIDHLKKTYCDSIGVEYLFMREPAVVKWLQERMEKSKNTPSFSKRSEERRVGKEC